jgi:carbamoyl-phosphate synthase small subunit
MYLHLADGTSLEGRAFGADCEVSGEVVFNTGMTGYVETLTDPSYHGQILVLTYPLQGNYGVSPAESFESGRIQVQGLVVSHYTDQPSHHASLQTLGAWLRADGVPAIYGVDTRALTRRLRERGTMPGHLARSASLLDPTVPLGRTVDMHAAVRTVTPAEVVRYPGGDTRILVIDTGAKENIVRELQARGATVIRAPHHASWEGMLDEVHGVMLTNGPGDPADCAPLVQRIRTVLAKGVPLFGICLGHQLLALAEGASTYKLKYGHRSQNQPVMDIMTRRASVTSQNHGYAGREQSLPADWDPWFVNLNDGTNEGLRHRHLPFRSVQFHPEASAGPHDTAYLFDEYLRMVSAMGKSFRT